MLSAERVTMQGYHCLSMAGLLLLGRGGAIVGAARCDGGADIVNRMQQVKAIVSQVRCGESIVGRVQILSAPSSRRAGRHGLIVK